ncbi:cyclase family protein [Mesobacillus harenae]|uniref:cyclase family protein n=1 Tax=Mesobacillus harenae TaxID=2213203 RepID=UPI001580D9EF|nr:cyclase family protein [Mesobacillus harenae]
MVFFSKKSSKKLIIDLSDCLSNKTSAVEANPHKIDYVDHEESLAVSNKLFGLNKEDWPDGHGWAAENVTLSTHSGTHVDAPYHYGPTSGGQPAKTIDQVPLEWCIGNGVVLNMSHKKAGERITDEDVQLELEKIEYDIQPYDIVLIRTDTSKKFGQQGYDQLHPGLSRKATQYLVEKGVRMIGIDAWGLDRPFDVMVEEAKKGDRSQLWESHLYGKEQEYLQIERLANLESIPVPYGFTVIALPVKIDGASAGWSRVVAIMEE